MGKEKLKHWLQNHNLIHLLYGVIWEFLIELIMLYDPASPPLGICPRET